MKESCEEGGDWQGDEGMICARAGLRQRLQTITKTRKNENTKKKKRRKGRFAFSSLRFSCFVLSCFRDSL
jgi:hypothetical protein